MVLMCTSHSSSNKKLATPLEFNISELLWLDKKSSSCKTVAPIAPSFSLLCVFLYMNRNIQWKLLRFFDLSVPCSSIFLRFLSFFRHSWLDFWFKHICLIVFTWRLVVWKFYCDYNILNATSILIQLLKITTQIVLATSSWRKCFFIPIRYLISYKSAKTYDKKPSHEGSIRQCFCVSVSASSHLT